MLFNWKIFHFKLHYRKKILPEGNQVTTRKIIVIRNGDENKYVLSETNFVKTNEDYYCFEDGK